MATSFQGELKRKKISAEDAAARVKSGDWVEYGFGLGQPDLFDRALAERAPALERVKIRGCLAMRPRAAVEADPDERHLTYLSWYFSGLERKMYDRGLAHHIPMNFGEAPDYYRRFIDVDIAVLKTAPMDEHGFFNFGPSVTYHKAISEKAKTLIVETDASMPYVFGIENAVHIDDVEFVLDAGASEMPELKNPAANAVDQKVAELIAPEIPSGACVQIGIGAMPNAVCELLAAAPIKDLGVHTEMFVDSLVSLFEAGKVTGAHKATNRYQMTYTFAAGSKRMYDFLDRNAACFAGPVDYTNLPQSHYAERSRHLDLQCRANRSHRAGVLRVGRRAADQRHGRAAAIRARRIRLARGQVVYMPRLDLRARRASREPNRRTNRRLQYRHDAAHRRDVRRDRVRHRQSQRQVGARTGARADLDRSS